MWNLKKYFLIGYTLHLQMICFESVSVDSAATPATISPFTTTPVMISQYTITPVTISPITTTPVINQNTTTTVTTSPVTTPVTTNPITTTPVMTSQKTITPVTTSQITTTPVVTSQNSTTTVITSPITITHVITSPITTTPDTTSQIKTTPVIKSQNTITPVTTNPSTTTPVITSPITTTPVTTSQIKTTPVTTSPITTTPVTTSPITTTPVMTIDNTITHVTTSPIATTPVTTSPITTTPVTSSQITTTPVTTSPVTTTPVRTSQNIITPFTTSPFTTTPVTTSPITTTPIITSPITTTSNTTNLKTITSVTTSPNHTPLVTTSQNTITPVTTSQKNATADIKTSGNESYLTEETDTTSVLNKDEIPVKVELVVRINKTFSNELTHKTSPTYKKYKREFKTKLEGVYKTMKNFLRIDVIGFRNGSIICDYAVILKPGSVTGTGKNDNFKDLQEHTARLNNTKIFDSLMTSPNSSIAKEFQQNTGTNPCYAIDCGRGYSCNKVVGNSVTCKHICSTLNKCQHEGECLFDSRHELPYCRCKQDSNYIYSGDYCEVKVEKFTMSKTNIIAIAAGAGGGVVLLLLVVIIALGVKYRRRHTDKQRDGKPDPLRSVSMDDLRFETRDSSRSSDGFLKRPKIYAAQNPYQSGLPDTKYVQGREHKVMKDYKGQETYLYQPTNQVKRSSRSSVASSSYTDHINNHVYDYIDTDSKFEIQRPNIRTGYWDKF